MCFNKTEDLNLSVFSMIIGINKSKTLTKHDHANVNLNLMGENIIPIKSGITKNIDVSVKNNICEKVKCEILLHVVAKRVNIMDDSVITSDEIIDADAKSNDEETKIIPTNFNEKKATYKKQNFFILIAFLLITIALLVVISIYYYLIKYRAKQKHLLPFHVTNNELKEIMY